MQVNQIQVQDVSNLHLSEEYGAFDRLCCLCQLSMLLLSLVALYYLCCTWLNSHKRCLKLICKLQVYFFVKLYLIQSLLLSLLSWDISEVEHDALTIVEYDLTALESDDPLFL